MSPKTTALYLLSLGLIISTQTGCQIGYIFQSGRGQLQILNARQPISEAEKDSRLNDEDRRKLNLAREAKEFGENELGLTPSKNYTRYAYLDRPYVSWVVSASPKDELKSYTWWFPIVGSVPYKGYFTEADAQSEEASLRTKNLDTYLRGVSAYSTLGWFEDAIVSPMLRYKDYDLVDTIIHESTHATLFIKSSADFNERMATFVGNKGSELFYLKKEGPQSPTVEQIRAEHEDDLRFSQFITGEIQQLEEWYKANKNPREEERKTRLSEIGARFKSRILPQMKTDSWAKFGSTELNNARLLLYKTYMQDLSDFEKLFAQCQNDMRKFIAETKKLEKSDNPEQALKKILK